VLREIVVPLWIILVGRQYRGKLSFVPAPGAPPPTTSKPHRVLADGRVEIEDSFAMVQVCERAPRAQPGSPSAWAHTSRRAGVQPAVDRARRAVRARGRARRRALRDRDVARQLDALAAAQALPRGASIGRRPTASPACVRDLLAACAHRCSRSPQAESGNHIHSAAVEIYWAREAELRPAAAPVGSIALDGEAHGYPERVGIRCLPAAARVHGARV